MTGFKFRLVAKGHAANAPDVAGGSQAAEVRPEDRAGGLKLRCLEQKFRAHHRHVIGVDQQDRAERAVENSVGFEFPAAKNTGRIFLSDLISVNAFDVEGGHQAPHPLVQFFPAQMPQLNGQRASKPAQHLQADPGIHKIACPAGADHDAVSSEAARIGGNGLEESFRGRSGIVDVQRRRIERFWSAGADCIAGRPGLDRGEVPEGAAVEIQFDPPDHFGRSNHIHAAGQVADDIEA